MFSSIPFASRSNDGTNERTARQLVTAEELYIFRRTDNNNNSFYS